MNFLFRIFCGLFLFLSLAFPLYPNGDEYTFRQLKIEDGLSQTTVLSIIQDHKGYMWFGTAFGLNKYDGYTFTVYTSSISDSAKLSDNRITCMFEDSKKNLWIGTIDGTLNLYNRSSNTFTHIAFIDTIQLKYTIPDQYYEYPISFSRNDNHSITSIAEDSEGFLWIGTWGKGLFRFNRNNLTYQHFYYSPDNVSGLSFNRITKVLIDSYGEIWIGTFGGGLNNVIRNKTGFSFKHFKAGTGPKGLSDDKVISLYEDTEKDVWIGTYYGGLHKLSRGSRSSIHGDIVFSNYKNIPGDVSSLSNNTVMAIVQDKSGTLWIGTFGGGLNKFDKKSKSFMRFTNDPFNSNSIGDNDVLSLYCDKSGIIWVGTHLGQGINKLEKNKIKFGTIKNVPGNPNSLNDNVVWAIHKDKNNVLWFGTYKGGLNSYDREKNKFKSYMPGKNSVTDYHNRSIAEDKFGNLWIGNYSNGLNCFNEKLNTFKHFRHEPDNPNSIGANQIQDIYIDSNSVMWLATFGGGLNYADISGNPQEVIVFHSLKNVPGDSTSLSDNRVYSLYEGKDGTLWIGSFGGGLHSFDKRTKKFKRFMHNPNDNNSLSNNRVMSVFEDSKGTVWAGTYGGGLNKLDKTTGTFKRYSEKEGLIGGVVYGVLEDDHYIFWMSTNNGIFKFDPVNEAFTQYDLQDGLQSLEFSGGAYFKANDGEMFFGGVGGINYFYPDSIIENQNLPPVVITSINIFNHPVAGEHNELDLAYNENFLTFEFAALDFTNPSDNRYAFMLVGLENEWRYTGSDLRIANYTNLSPGEYVFRVKGSNNDGVWNEAGVSIRILISPPFWQTWWFLLITIFFAALFIYYISTIRIKNLLAIEKLKTKLAADLHDNVGSGLTEISILSELVVNEISKEKQNASQKLQMISETARQLVDTMSDIVWVVNPKRDSLHDLIIRLKDSYDEILNSTGVSFKTSNLEKLSNVKLPMEYRQNLFLIFKEAINNSIKHSRCKNLILDANVRGDAIEMTLVDDGIGMNEINMMAGNGMKNIESRARTTGGRIKWKTSPGTGTTVKFIGHSNKRNFFQGIINLSKN